jgi:predicted Fe-S protein YdhL (DUF1289 family)
MAKFQPCIDRNACTEEGRHCRGCGRTHREIALTRSLTTDLARLLAITNYENLDEFMNYLLSKADKKLKHL